MDRCALFVDAGYLLSDGAMAVHGTARRDAVSWDYPGLMRLLTDLSRERTGLPLLRCYWYDATVEGRRTAEHDTLADLPGLKLRLARIRPGRREGVDAQVHRDLMTLARNSAICDAVIVSGDEDLTQVICDAQDLGMRVTVMNVTPAADGARALRQECDDLIELDTGRLRPYVALSAGAEQPALGPGRSAPGGRRRGHALPSGRSADSPPQPDPLPVRRPEALPTAASADHTSRHAAAPADGSGDDPLRRTLEGLRDLSGDDSQRPDTGSETHSDAYAAVSLTGIDLPRIADHGPDQNGTPNHMGGQSGAHSSTGQPGQQGQQGQQGQNGSAQSGAAQAGMAQGGMSGASQAGLSQAGLSQSGLPQDGMTQSGVAQTGAAQTGAIQSGATQSGVAQMGTAPNNTGHSGTDRQATGAMPPAAPPAPQQAPQQAMPPPPSGTGTSAPGYYSGSAAPSNGSYQARPAGASAGSHSASYPGDSTGAYPPPSPPLTAPTGMQAYPGQHQQQPPPQQPRPTQQQPPLGPYTAPQPSAPVQQAGPTLTDAVKSAHKEGHDFGESVARDAPALWLEAVLARKPRMPSDLEARLLQGSSLPIDFLLHDEVRHALRRGFWDALEHARH